MRVRRAVAMIPGARWIKRRLVGPAGASPASVRTQVPIGRPDDRGPPPSADHARLAVSYRNSTTSRDPDTFVLYRIIGNDLPPRHAPGQSRENLAFILEHERPLPACEKRFVVNRIVNQAEEHAILELLRESGTAYVHLPFDLTEYRGIAWDVEGVPVDYAPWTEGFSRLSAAEQGRVLMRLYRHKNNYVMNNNGARNAALREGRGIAKWVLPWDGNCFVTDSAWNDIVSAVTANPELPCLVVPMARVTDNTQLLEAEFRPQVDGEPQILFRRDATVEFDPAYCYGRRPKVELLWRLGVPGTWDAWTLEPWDLPCPAYANEACSFGYGGWVARLFSGQGASRAGFARRLSAFLFNEVKNLAPPPS